jgi:hypothetical protein
MDHVSILKPEVVSRGLSICRLETGQIVISVHRGEQRIMFEMSEKEFSEFARDCGVLCEQFRKSPHAGVRP